MSGWLQREAERKEDEANEMDELITENRKLSAERDQLRNALAAHVERLVGAVELAECYMKTLRHELARNNATFDGSEDQAEVDGDLAKVRSALAATPAQSLAAHDAALLREVTKRFAYRRNDGDWTIHPDSLTAEADRIEKEAKNGEENDRQNQDNKCIG